MNIFKEPYAEWRFVGFHEPIISKSFIELSLKDKRQFIMSRIGNFRVVLDAFSRYKLLDINYIYVNDRPIPLHERNKKSFESIINIINEEDIQSWIFTVIGSTSIYINETQKKVDGIIHIIFEPIYDIITVETYSDVWQPININTGTIDVSSAIINSNRLEECLKKVKNNGVFKEIEPDEGCDYIDSALQHGFRLYSREALIKKNYPKLDLVKIAPFIWERRRKIIEDN